MARNNKRARRTGHRELKYGRYLIFTNGEQTEVNYFIGLKNSLPQEVQENIQITVFHCELRKLENEIQRKRSKYQYAKTYLVLDRDRESEKTLKTIAKIAKINNCNIIFSAPCIEYWFLKHFNNTVTFQECKLIAASQQCIIELKKYIKNYNKNDGNIYNTINSLGCETTAVKLAKKECKQHKGKSLYNITNATNMYELIEEIKNLPLTFPALMKRLNKSDDTIKDFLNMSGRCVSDD